MTKGILRAGLACAAALALTACGFGESFAEADTEVAEFHRRIDTQKFDQIWNESHPKLHGDGDKAAFSKFFGDAHNALGKVVSTKQVGWQSNFVNADSFIVLKYETQFQRGNAFETFTFIKQDKGLKLFGYNIDPADGSAVKAPIQTAPSG